LRIFKTAKEALFAFFRPCKRCKPLSHPNQVSQVIQTLVKAVEDHSEKRWKEEDFRQLSIDISTARRQFKKRFGTTFVEYARARRIGLAMKEIREGNTVLDAQLSAGYELSSGFRDAFSKIMGKVPSSQHHRILYATWMDTKLGRMIAMGDEKALYLLDFVDRRTLEREIDLLRKKWKVAIIPGETDILKSIQTEVKNYFEGKSFEFKTPMQTIGSLFQKKVWEELKKIPVGETRSYLDIAKAIGLPTAYRAVANANGANKLGIIIPCHRVINHDGELGGYGGGIARKKWLLEHERNGRK